MAIIPEIQAYLDTVTAAFVDISQVWLFGSRANGTAKDSSDWDFFVFANANVLHALRCDRWFQRTDVDLLIVTDGDNFECPWERSDFPGSFKRGHLMPRRIPNVGYALGFDWRFIDDVSAVYTITRMGYYRTLQSVRVFTRESLHSGDPPG